MVFVDFDREDFIFKSFWLNILSPARSSAFFMYTIFFLKINSSWRKVGFCVENTVENVSWMTESQCMTMFSTVFSTQNPRFLHHDLIFRKNMIYMKNAKERAGLKIFSQKLLKMKSSLSKSTKTIEIYANHLLYGFLKELMMCRFCRFCLDLRFEIFEKNLSFSLMIGSRKFWYVFNSEFCGTNSF